MSALPPALARLATVLELSSGVFSLSFVTGPRDHVDSVYLRLVRALGDSYEFVRHRVDRDGVNLRGPLGGATGERPRVVFVSGLERMSDEARADATARLNLVRDSWAPYPAQVIVWLPAWGLAEFRRLAPDLFDWRSNLTVLHDADLPVRDEEEYLVWVVERHGSGTRTHSALGLVAALRRIVLRREIVLVGYGAAEREVLMRDAAMILAGHRLHAGLGATARPDLDLFASLDQSPIESWARAPVLLRAVEMAGSLDPEPGWSSVARAAGIPGAPGAAAVLAALAENVDLIVLLDSVDMLDLRVGDPAYRLLNWLRTTPARLVAITAGKPPPLMSGWRTIAREFVDFSDPLTMFQTGREPSAILAWLLSEMFTDPDDLVLLAAYWFGPDVSSEISPHGGRGEVAAHFVDVCDRYGLLDSAFFDELKRLRPRHAKQIDDVALAYLHRQ